MPVKINLIGQKFNHLTVIAQAPNRGLKTYWLCKCDCGKEKEIQTTHLKNGAIKTCGCGFGLTDNQQKECEICGKVFIPLPGGASRKYCYDCSPTNCSRSQAIAILKKAMKAEMVKRKGGKCERCGYDKCIDALHFHHVNEEEKEFGLAEGGKTHSWQDFKAEAEKCILLCANCHAEEHYARNHIV